jgi:hypothetical protein
MTANRWSSLLAVLMLVSAPLAAQDPGSIDARLDILFGEHDSYRRFLTDLQQAVAKDARSEVAAMVAYPLTTHIAGKKIILQTPAEFLQHYDQLLPAKALAVIRAQTYPALFANAQGVMIGAGEVWFSGVCADSTCGSRTVRITAINPPAKERS